MKKWGRRLNVEYGGPDARCATFFVAIETRMYSCTEQSLPWGKSSVGDFQEVPSLGHWNQYSLPFFFSPTLITFRTSVSKNTIEMQIVLVSTGLCVLGSPLESEWRKAHRDLVYLLRVWTYWWPQIGNHWVSRHHQQEAQRFICQCQRTEQWKRRATVHLRFIDEQTDEKRTCIFLQSGLMGWGRS